MHRPAAAAAVGRACADLNRLAEPMTALQKLRPRILLFRSLASVVHGDEHVRRLNATYIAANFLGLPLGFVTERQLKRYADGSGLPPRLSEAAVILCPAVSHVPEASVRGLERFTKNGGHVVRLGSGFAADEYGRPRAVAAAPGHELSVDFDDGPALMRALATGTADWGATPDVTLAHAEGEGAWGVEIRSASHGAAWVASICNHRREPQRVVVLAKGRGMPLRDLISGRDIGPELDALPMQPLLVVPR